jgi:hypothetical protein
MENMTIDQLVMAIYPMLFYSGQTTGDGDFNVSPAVVKQKRAGTTIDQVKIDYDNRGFDGVEFLQNRMDENTGITKTIQGEVTGQTLGEVLQAKDASLKRLSIPLSNIAQALQQEAYISLSWMNQIYSLPEVKEFSNQDEFDDYMEENEIEPIDVQETEEGKIEAQFLPVLDLSIENRNGDLVESPENRFFKLGIDIEPKKIYWEGIITVNPQSILAPSQELERQRKLELFNLVVPIVTQIATAIEQGTIGIAKALYKPVQQILEIQNEKPENWLPDELVRLIEDPKEGMKEIESARGKEQPLFIRPEEQGQPQRPSQQAQTVAPRGEVSNPLRNTLGKIGQIFKRQQ